MVSLDCLAPASSILSYLDSGHGQMQTMQTSPTGSLQGIHARTLMCCVHTVTQAGLDVFWTMGIYEPTTQVAHSCICAKTWASMAMGAHVCMGHRTCRHMSARGSGLRPPRAGLQCPVLASLQAPMACRPLLRVGGSLALLPCRQGQRGTAPLLPAEPQPQ